MHAFLRRSSTFLRAGRPARRAAARHARREQAALLLLFACPSAALAQWLDHPTPGIPRTPDGKPDMSAPAPRTPEGKPDFSGIWFANVPATNACPGGDCIQEERMAREQ